MVKPLFPVNSSQGGIFLRSSAATIPSPEGVYPQNTITVAGTIQPASKDTYECTLAGTAAIGDTATIVINGTSYSSSFAAIATEVYKAQIGGAPGTGDVIHTDVKNAGTTVRYEVESTPGSTKITLAQEIADSCNLGTKDKWKFAITGGPAMGGEVMTVTINGVGYSYTCGLADSNATIATGIATALAGNTLYSVAHPGTSVIITALSRGAAPTVALTGAIAHTDTHSIPGVAGQTNWVASSDGVDTVSFTFHNAGAINPALYNIAGSVTLAAGSTTYTVTEFTAGANTTIPTIIGTIAGLIAAGDPTYTATDDGSSKVIPVARVAGPTTSTVTSMIIGGVGATFTANHTVTGGVGDIARVTDNSGTTFSHTVVTGNTTDAIATALAASIDAHARYTATALGSVVTVVGSQKQSYIFTDSTINNVGGGVALSCTCLNTVPGAITRNMVDTSVYDVRPFTIAYADCKINGGTGYSVKVWLYHDDIATWILSSTNVLNVDTIIQIDLNGATGLALEVYGHGGGSTATIGLDGE